MNPHLESIHTISELLDYHRLQGELGYVPPRSNRKYDLDVGFCGMLSPFGVHTYFAVIKIILNSLLDQVPVALTPIAPRYIASCFCVQCDTLVTCLVGSFGDGEGRQGEGIVLCVQKWTDSPIQRGQGCATA